MSIGLFRKQISWLRLKYDGVSIPIPQSTYEKNGYSPIVNRHRGQITAGAGSNAIKTIEKKPIGMGSRSPPTVTPVCTENLNTGEAVMQSAQDGA
jgi:hypothetical protein